MPLANETDVPKAAAADFPGRFREIVSDPLNLLIRRHPQAGLLDEGRVRLHNGLRVPASGPDAYYGTFSDILVVNRGVHEPLEEFVFQQLLDRVPADARMMELGAYWGHYSMWLKARHPAASVLLVEPEASNLDAGRRNFEANGLEGDFLQAFVGRDGFVVDEHLAAQRHGSLTILHADIQGSEVEMLEGCEAALAQRRIDYLFVSTHSQELHRDTCAELTRHGYRVEVSSDFDLETTSFDGFVFASSPRVDPMLDGFVPLSRRRILEASAAEIVDYLVATMALAPRA